MGRVGLRSVYSAQSTDVFGEEGPVERSSWEDDKLGNGSVS